MVPDPHYILGHHPSTPLSSSLLFSGLSEKNIYISRSTSNNFPPISALESIFLVFFTYVPLSVLIRKTALQMKVPINKLHQRDF